MSRTQEQIEAVAELTVNEIADYRKLDALPDDTIGLDSISKHSCYTNGWESCKGVGIASENGFSESEICTASARFTIKTAKFFELI